VAVSTRVTETTRAVIRRLFTPADHRVVEDLLVEQCGPNLPLTDLWDEPQFERLRLAVLKLSDGDLAALRRAVGVAQVDWRDVLVAAGFGNSLEGHHQWAHSLMA
jgi:hypothetical protein